MKQSHFMAALALILFGAANSESLTRLENDVKIVNSNKWGCEVIYKMSGFELDTLSINSIAFQRIKFDRSFPRSLPGNPLIPARILIFGLPAGAEARVTVKTTIGEVLTGINCLPIPEMIETEGIAQEHYQKNAVYDRDNLFPAQIYEVENAWSGNQRVCKVILYPVQYSPLSGRLNLNKSINIRVDFTKPAIAVNKLKKQKRNSINDVLINGLEVAYWEKEQGPKSLSKLNSNMSKGIWIRIPITEEGIYQVKGSDLEDLGVTLAGIDLTTIKIYGRNGRELSHNLAEAFVDTLKMIPCLLDDGADGVFDRNDAVLFYACGTENLEWNASEARYWHYLNRYTKTNVFWLVLNDDRPGLRAGMESQGDPAAATEISTFKDVVFSERDVTNPLGAGLLWYGREFRLSAAGLSRKFVLPDPEDGKPARVFFRWAGGTSGVHKFKFDWNSQAVENFTVNSTMPTTRQATFSEKIIDRENKIRLTYSYIGSALEPNCYLDWTEIEYTRKIVEYNNVIRFFSPQKAGQYRYLLKGFKAKPLVFKIADLGAITRIEPNGSSDNYSFTLPQISSQPTRFIAAVRNDLPVPSEMKIAANSDLRHPANGCDLLIITHEDFKNEASRLADHRSTADSLKVQVVDIENVYNEFAGGMFDPGAIRNFVKYAFDNWSQQPAYLLLFGDGDYDYRDLLTSAGGNWIPPYECDGRTNSSSCASDDWFTKVHGGDSEMDLAVGRLPVRTISAAKRCVDRIIQYETNPEYGSWRNCFTLVADDEKAGGGVGNEVNHTRAIEYIAESILPFRFDINKIYLTEYEAEITGNGLRKPRAKEDLINSFNRGTVFMNYIGHGNQKLWAHEWIFQRDRDLESLENIKQLPLVYAATCSFGWYDKINEQSFAEELVYAEGGGAIAVIASARLCSAPYNEALNKEFLRRLLPANGPSMRIGDALRLAKSSAGTSSNNRLYHLLGDPALRLAVPRYETVFTSLKPDSFKALGVITATGEIKKDGALYDAFNGQLELQAFDSRKSRIYTTSYGTRLLYLLGGNSLFRGEADVVNGRFKVSFVVPKDISYGGIDGRLSSYFWNEEFDGSGFKNNIAVGGSSGLNDLKGPAMSLGFSDREGFMSGDMITAPAELKVRIEDDLTGINLTGEIGHKIIMTLDGGSEQDMTSLFSYDKNNYLKGSLAYSLASLKEGNHFLAVKAWDNANNSTAKSINFEVVSKDELRLERVMNYPNPFDRNTDFTFYLSTDADITIKIFTVSGRLIRILEDFIGKSGFNMIDWDGTDEMGDRIATGVYLYKIIASSRFSEKTLKTEKIERLMIVH